jgi:DNA-binding response OmpR family regulator
MAQEVILLIEKHSGKSPTFAAALVRKGYAVEVVSTGSEAVLASAGFSPALVILNAASLGSSGERIGQQLRDVFDAPLIHILDEGGLLPDGSKLPRTMLLRLPFTARKLVNRVKRLWPVSEENTLSAGPVELVMETRLVRAHGRETRLTPKAASLLEVFMRHSGETLDREFLMRQVWNTDYLGDTRTLDVHVRWVRQAIEHNAARPCFIRTVRGLGYRFEPEPPELEADLSKTASAANSGRSLP